MKIFSRNFAVSMFGAFVVLSANASLSAAIMLPQQNKFKAAEDQSFRTQIVPTGSNSQIRQNGRDAVTKHNPNAALIGQMLGGEKSIDIDGLGRADVSPRHYAYCFRTYGSYRVADNTYLQFSGTRAQCVSPFYNGEE